MSRLTFKRPPSAELSANQHSITVDEFLNNTTHHQVKQSSRRTVSQPNRRSRKKIDSTLHYSLSAVTEPSAEYEELSHLNRSREKDLPAYHRTRPRLPNSILSFGPAILAPQTHTTCPHPLRLDTPFLTSLRPSPHAPVINSKKRFFPVSSASHLAKRTPPVLKLDKTVPKHQSSRLASNVKAKLSNVQRITENQSTENGLRLVSRKEHEDAFQRLKNIFRTNPEPMHSLYVKHMKSYYPPP